MDARIISRDTLEMLEILREQRERVTSSKKEAKKLLKQLGLWHRLVPIEKEKKHRSAGKKK
jgi:hypothetical protein